MSLTPHSFGLGAWPINSPYRTPRTQPDGTTCPHAGIDIATGGESVPFTAGVYGVVVATGGGTNRVEVQPFGVDRRVIRYLHCHFILVRTGDPVSPWTTLGTTGSTGGGSTGIHLHVDVVAVGEPSSEPGCWSREFLDPGAFPVTDLLAGQWFQQGRSTPTASQWQRLTVTSSAVGAAVVLRLGTFFQQGHCTVDKTTTYTGRITRREGPYAYVQFGKGVCELRVEGNCRPQCKVIDGFLTRLWLESADSLLLGSGSRYARRDERERKGRLVDSSSEPDLVFTDVVEGVRGASTPDAYVQDLRIDEPPSAEVDCGCIETEPGRDPTRSE